MLLSALATFDAWIALTASFVDACLRPVTACTRTRVAESAPAPGTQLRLLEREEA